MRKSHIVLREICPLCADHLLQSGHLIYCGAASCPYERTAGPELMEEAAHYSHFTPQRPPAMTNSQWAQDIRAKVADLNEALQQAPERSVIVGWHTHVDDDNVPHVIVNLSERI